MSATHLEDNPFASDEDLRQYVEAELDVSVRRVRPELGVDFGARAFTVIPRSTSLCWLIEEPRRPHADGLRDRHYLLEARLAGGEFIIWFGAVHGVNAPGAVTRDVMLPAVHVPFSLVCRDTQVTHEAYSLSAVLLWMLDHAVRPVSRNDPLVFPMNGHLY